MSFIIGIRNQIFRLFYRLARPLIFLMDPENAHYTLKRVGVFLGSNPVTRGLTTLLFDYGHKSLNIKVDGIEYRNPVGLSAGVDKDGELTSIYPSLGFGLAELGSFTGEVCPGNPGKRLFRMVKSRSIVVWYGLNNFGAEKISKRLANVDFGRLRVGINAAKSNVTPEFDLQESIRDYLKTMTLFKDIGDYYTINISCPNTDKNMINDNIECFINSKRKWCILKLSPYCDIKSVDTYYNQGFRQFHCCNTLPVKEGGLSGKSLIPYSVNLIQNIKNKYSDTIIIGGGGIRDVNDIITYNKAGAVHYSISTLFFNPFLSYLFYKSYINQ